MAVGKEILTKIRSVQNTQKITKAMQMVSTSKMRKTQDRMRLARPYAEKSAYSDEPSCTDPCRSWYQIVGAAPRSASCRFHFDYLG